jgi:hypothetical protein
LRRYLVGIVKAKHRAMKYQAAMAELSYEIQQAEDWKLLINPETEKRYKYWNEFREPFAEALGISTGTLGKWLKLVRYGREILHLEPGEFGDVNGLLTVNHMDEMSVVDWRNPNAAATVRPKTQTFKDYLEKNYVDEGSEGWDDLLRRYYNAEVRHQFDDPSAINRPAAELAAQARDRMGTPDFRAAWLFDDRSVVYGLKLRVKYPDVEADDGTTVMGDVDEYTLVFKDTFVPPAVRDWIGSRLRVQD